jgi:hypothetical protein
MERYLLEGRSRGALNALISVERTRTSQKIVCEQTLNSRRVQVLITVAILRLWLLISVEDTLAVSDPPPLDVSQNSSAACLWARRTPMTIATIALGSGASIGQGRVGHRPDRRRGDCATKRRHYKKERWGGSNRLTQCSELVNGREEDTREADENAALHFI